MLHIYIYIYYIYESQIVRHNPCFNLFILRNNSFDNQKSEINKNDNFLRFETLSFTKFFFLYKCSQSYNQTPHSVTLLQTNCKEDQLVRWKLFTKVFNPKRIFVLIFTLFEVKGALRKSFVGWNRYQNHGQVLGVWKKKAEVVLVDLEWYSEIAGIVDFWSEPE